LTSTQAGPDIQPYPKRLLVSSPERNENTEITSELLLSGF
jgi:hypothetical protein